MTRTRDFIDREAFDDLIRNVPRADGGTYEDIATIYGDMSRLVVAWIANTPADDLHRRYNDLGWGGSANVRAIQEAAKQWMREHRPESL